LHGLQEELERLFIEKQSFKQKYEQLSARFGRIERNYNDIIDYDDIKIIGINTTSKTPYLLWEAKNFYHAGVLYPKFNALILLNEGKTGIAVIELDMLSPKSGENKQLAKNILYPHLLATPELIIQNYKLLGTLPWRRITSGFVLLQEILNKVWSKIQFPQDMDPNFWRPNLAHLLEKAKTLPPVVSFERVTIKRELRNIDYEHIWLEIHNLQFGKNYFLPKFEFRIGASMLEAGGFSRHPKYEIPLIDGKTKPFESWYAESGDEYGSKFELRFDLNNNAADFRVLSKLNKLDLYFVINIMLAIPQFINYLLESKITVSRSWDDWTAFVDEANQMVLKALQAILLADIKKTDVMVASRMPQEQTILDGENLIPPIKPVLKKSSKLPESKKLKGPIKVAKKPPAKKVAAKKVVTKKKK
jgi:hypothetical protein